MNNETVFHRWFLLRGVEMKRALVLGGGGAKGAAPLGLFVRLKRRVSFPTS
jgi:predicted acylesterase/phospholipase RssA